MDDVAHAYRQRDDAWIMTYTGRRFWPLAPRAEDVDIRDIAHALALKCRYGGHSSRFYSVAQHSVLVSHYVPTKHAMAGLLHDAAEAYLADIPRPVKCDVPGWKELEAKVMDVIADKLKLPEHPMAKYSMYYIEPREVKAIDTAILWPEMKALMGPASLDALIESMGALVFDPMRDVVIEPWPWERAEWEFLKRHDEIMAEIAR